MKKIITLLFCSAILTSAFAQRDDHDRRDDKNSPAYQNNNYRVAERNRMIQKISNQYDFKIQQVYNDRGINRRQRKNTIKYLESEKAQQINRIYEQYNNSAFYNRSQNRNNDYKSNNDNDRYSNDHHDNEHNNNWNNK